MAHSSPVILIVEDELLLRMDSAEMIENADFEVVQAGNADEAIAILRARSLDLFWLGPSIHMITIIAPPSASIGDCESARSHPTREFLMQDLRFTSSVMTVVSSKQSTLAAATKPLIDGHDLAAGRRIARFDGKPS